MQQVRLWEITATWGGGRRGRTVREKPAEMPWRGHGERRDEETFLSGERHAHH